MNERGVAANLVQLTEELAKRGEDTSGGLLGGEFGYGAYFENETFMMHPFCWCDREDCPWCWGCECPEEAWSYTVSGRTVDHDEWLDAYDDPATRDQREILRHPEMFCAYCRGDKPGEPNFRHKPSGTEITWYKYIGRSMNVDLRGEWLPIFMDCLNSLEASDE